VEKALDRVAEERAINRGTLDEVYKKRRYRKAARNAPSLGKRTKRKHRP
jgi:hypothetical protein